MFKVIKTINITANAVANKANSQRGVLIGAGSGD